MLPASAATSVMPSQLPVGEGVPAIFLPKNCSRISAAIGSVFGGLLSKRKDLSVGLNEGEITKCRRESGAVVTLALSFEPLFFRK